MVFTDVGFWSNKDTFNGFLDIGRLIKDTVRFLG